MYKLKSRTYYKKILNKINEKRIISREEFFELIQSNHENYIPKYFKGKIIASITHNHAYFISVEFLSRNADRNGFYTTKSGITFHIRGDFASVLKYLIRKRSYGLTVDEAESLCNRECARGLEKVLENNNYSKEKILGVVVYLYDPRKNVQIKERYTNDRIAPRTKDDDGNLVIPLEEISESLKLLMGESMSIRKLMVNFLKVHLGSPWRYLSNLIKYTPRYRSVVGLSEEDDLHFTTLNKYFLDLPLSDLQDIFKRIVEKLSIGKVIKGKILAIDATHIFAWANKNNPMCRTPYPESDSYMDDSYLHFAQHGVHQGKFYGYKVHLLVDCESELPVAVTITSGNDSDMSQIFPLLENVEGVDLLKVERLLADAGYDFPKEIDKVNGIIKGKMIVDTNPRRNGSLMQIKKMVKGIFEKFGNVIKTIDDALNFIPQKLLSRFSPKVGDTGESSIVKLCQYHISTGLRVSVERVFSRLKCMLGFERPKVQKDISLIKHLQLCINWMLLVAFTADRLGYHSHIRKMASVV